MNLPSYLDRRAAPLVTEALGDTRVVVVIGARQAGKSTLVHEVSRDISNVRERRLDRPNELQAATADPVAFVEHDGLLVVDEIQRAPELLLPIKARVDVDQRPGQYILTGSPRLLGLRNVPDALVGRTETVELWPFSQGELDGSPDEWVDRVFDVSPDWRSPEVLERTDYLERSVRGGFPEAVRRQGRRRERFFESYVNDLLDRDVTQLADIQRRSDLHRLLRLVADSMAQPMVIARVSSALQLPESTTRRYLSLFEEVFLIKRLPAWSATATKRASRTPKTLFVDTGIGSHLAGLGLGRLQRDEALAGPVLENLVLSELAKQISWSLTRPWLGHYRTRDGDEVDGVLEAPDGRIVGIEVKSARSVRSEDFRGLKHLQSRVPQRFHHGVVLYTGDEVLSFGAGLTAQPISSLWA